MNSKCAFSLKNEDRTLWEATSTYVDMSPFMSANKIKKPILLIHGEEDNNTGTLTMQVDSPPSAVQGIYNKFIADLT